MFAVSGMMSGITTTQDWWHATDEGLGKAAA
jgi:hypothetical protein